MDIKIQLVVNFEKENISNFSKNQDGLNRILKSNTLLGKNLNALQLLLYFDSNQSQVLYAHDFHG